MYSSQYTQNVQYCNVQDEKYTLYYVVYIHICLLHNIKYTYWMHHNIISAMLFILFFVQNFSCTEFWDPSLVVIQDFTSNCSHVFEVRMWLHTPYSCTPLYCRQSTVSRWQGCLRASWGPKGSAAPGTGETTVNTYRGLGMCRWENLHILHTVYILYT